MNNLTFASFLVPAIALLLSIISYSVLLKRTTDKMLFKRFSFAIIVIAFLLNFIWEMLQMPLYKNMPLNIKSIVYCGLASLADVIMVVLLYYGFALIYKDAFWTKDLNVQRIVLLMLIGCVGAILAELRHLSSGNWSYAETMPVIPIVNVGLSPVLQFMILPVVIYSLSFRFSKKEQQKHKFLFIHF